MITQYKKLLVKADAEFEGDLIVASGKGLEINEGIAGKAVLQGSTAYNITRAYNAAMNPGTDQISIEFWCYKTSNDDSIDRKVLVGRANDWMVTQYYPNQMVFTFDIWNGVPWVLYNFDTVWTAGAWHCFQVNYDKTAQLVRFFIDGVLKSSQACSTAFPNSTNGLMIGGWSSTDHVWEFDGRIDEVRVSNCIRNTTDYTPSTDKFVNDANTMLLYHFDEGTGTTVEDFSSNGLDATINGSDTSWVDGAVSGGDADKNILKRTSGSPETGAGTLTMGYAGDTVKVAPLGTNGFVKTSGSDGTLSVDTTDYQEFTRPVTTVTDTYQVLVTDQVIVCNKSSAFTITLPVAVVGQKFYIKNIGAGVVTIEGYSSDTIDAETNQALQQWEAMEVVCHAANAWSII